MANATFDAQGTTTGDRLQVHQTRRRHALLVVRAALRRSFGSRLLLPSTLCVR
jgi:hypothetical protein